MKFYKSYRKYLFKRDTLFSTFSVFLLIGLLALIPLNTNVLNPIKTALVDFDFNDIAYAKLGKNSDTRLDERIVIVNIGTADRAQIAGMVEAISQSKPKVIGLDASFNGAKDPQADAMVLQVLKNSTNVIGASRLEWLNKEEVEQRGYFSNAFHQFGNVILALPVSRLPIFAFVVLFPSTMFTFPFKEYTRKLSCACMQV